MTLELALPPFRADELDEDPDGQSKAPCSSAGGQPGASMSACMKSTSTFAPGGGRRALCTATAEISTAVTASPVRPATPSCGLAIGHRQGRAAVLEQVDAMGQKTVRLGAEQIIVARILVTLGPRFPD